MGDLATTSRFKRRPITSAMSRNGAPWSAILFYLAPAEPFSSASLKRWAAIEPVHRGAAVGPIAHRKKTIDRVSLDPCHNKEKERVAGNHFEEEIVGPS